MCNIVIFGAGKIARGFINHLLAVSGLESTFVEKSPELCRLINERRAYGVHVLGNSEKSMRIENANAVQLDDKEAVAELVAGADLMFTAVGGKNLDALVPVLAQGLSLRFERGITTPSNLITCENWKKPADILKNGVQARLSPAQAAQLEEQVGFSESVVMRSAIEADPQELEKDPLIVNVQDFWSLPVDGGRIVGKLPPVEGIALMENFGGFLERKFYTYNAANGTVSYVGSTLGHSHIAQASRDPFVAELLTKIYNETTAALCKKHGTPYEEQKKFADSSLQKLRDEKIVDTLERNARDPIRKLSPDDRLIGSARLMLEYGVEPDGILTSIACAIFYEGGEKDEAALALKEMRETEGVDAVLQKVCKLDPKGVLAQKIKTRIQDLQTAGILK